jgi:hypothetical protein
MNRYLLNRERFGLYLLIAAALVTFWALIGWPDAQSLVNIDMTGASAGSSPALPQVDPRTEAADISVNPELKSLQYFRATAAKAAQAKDLYRNPELKTPYYYPAGEAASTTESFLAANPEIMVFRRYQRSLLER